MVRPNLEVAISSVLHAAAGGTEVNFRLIGGDGSARIWLRKHPRGDTARILDVIRTSHGYVGAGGWIHDVPSEVLCTALVKLSTRPGEQLMVYGETRAPSSPLHRFVEQVWADEGIEA